MCVLAEGFLFLNIIIITVARMIFYYSLSHNTLQSRCNHQSLVSKRGFLLLSLGFLATCHYQEVNFDLKLTSGMFMVFQSSKGAEGKSRGSF